MKRISISLTAAVVALAGASLAHAEGETVSAYGTGQVTVTPKNPKSEKSIRAAVAAAQQRSLPLAVENARANAQAIADAAGLTLGGVMTVAQQINPYLIGGFGGFGGGIVLTPGSGIVGPFSGKFCGRVSRPVFKKVNGKRKVVRRVHERRCFVPGAVANTLEVTFHAVPKVSA